MRERNYFVGIKNFKNVSNGLLDEAVTCKIDDGAILYAKTKENCNCVFVNGNIGAMICLIAEMIMLMSKKSGFPISAILTTITHIIWIERGTLR